MDWIDVKSVISFIGGGGVLWVLNYALSLRKQSKDEFQILRETWKDEFKKYAEKIGALELEIKGKDSKLEEQEQKLQMDLITKQNMWLRLEDLQAQLSYLNLVDNDNPVPMWFKDKKGTMLDLNDAYEKMFLTPNSKSKKDYIGFNDVDVWGDEIGVEYQKNDTTVIIEKRVITTKETVNISGDVRYMWFMKYPVFLNGDVYGTKGLAILIPND